MIFDLVLIFLILIYLRNGSVLVDFCLFIDRMFNMIIYIVNEIFWRKNGFNIEGFIFGRIFVKGMMLIFFLLFL